MLHEIILNAGGLKNHWVYQFCIMPDHVHILCRPNHHKRVVRNPVAGTETCDCGGGMTGNIHVCGGEKQIADLRVRDLQPRVCDVPPDTKLHTISDYMYTLKSFFVYRMRQKFGVEYKFLQTRYNFRILDNDRYLSNVINYITHNPIKAELPKKWQQYPYQYKNDDLIDRLF